MVADHSPESAIRNAQSAILPRAQSAIRNVVAGGLMVAIAFTALMPVVTVLGLQFGTLIGGAVIIEYVFALADIDRADSRDAAAWCAGAHDCARPRFSPRHAGPDTQPDVLSG